MSEQSTDKEKLARAAQYLEHNADLRRALEIPVGEELEPHFLGNGEHNENFWFESATTEKKYVLRINVAKQAFHKDQIAYEYRALKALQESGCVPTPRYLDSSEQAPAFGALVEDYCVGEQLNFDALRPGDLRCAAQLMANIHAVQVPKNCEIFRPEDPLRALFDECIERFNVYLASPYEDAKLTRRMRAFIESTQNALESVRASCIHNDCTHIVNTETLPSHFLIPSASANAAAQNSQTSGAFCENPGTFVDWERPVIGEVAQDLAYFVAPTTTFWDSEFLFPKEQVQAFLEDYWRAVDGRFERGSFDSRFWAWFKLTALRSQTWCCKALLAYGENGSGYTTKKTADKLRIYLSDDFMDFVSKECFEL